MDISILFATRNRAAQLEQTLASYRALDMQGLEWELLIVDNASTDATADVIERMRDHLPIVCSTFHGVGKNRALNEMLPQLRGSLVVFTDDDVLPEPDCIRAYIDAAQRWSDDVVFGARIEPRFPAGTPDWMQSPDFEFSTTAFARYQPAAQEGPVRRHPYGPSFAVRRSAFEGMCFNEQLGPQSGSYAMGGEADFLRRLHAKGHRYIYVPQARVAHVVRPEQVHADWLLARANKKGRGQVYLPSNKKKRRIRLAGAPLKLWLAVSRSWLRYRLATLRANERERLQKGIAYQLRLGELQQRLKDYSSTA
ncbi:family 2 glycosyl transferase [Salinisphaera sp. C84B14]|uniref:glycosyltransferase family 2 protein n=1 Tax=Salinisphaera sp. C84B14 TaxID=1304155 RepID=UPI003340CC6D